MDELNSMRAFVNVVEAGSFTGAARRMGISPSVITKRINQLEDHLSVELLRRSTRQLTVTDMGSAYFERCTRILGEVDEARAAVNTMNWGLSGMFRISCTGSFASRYLSRDVCEFQVKHPQLKIDCRLNDYVYDPIQEGYDVCIQPRDILNDAITKRPIATLHRLLIATPAYIKKYGEPRLPSELANHRLAYNNFVTPDCEIVFKKDDSAETVVIDPTVLTNSISLLEEAVLNGECIALVPIFYFADQLADGSVVPILGDYLLPRAELSIYYRRSPHVPMKIRTFLNFILERYGPSPPWLGPILKKSPELAPHFR